jgi:Domain of unknown function (DUF4129)
MPGSDKATGRLVALAALLLVAGVGLRGYLPGDAPAPRERSTDSPASLFAVVAVLSVSVAIVALAIITWLRDPRRGRATPHELPRRLGGAQGRPRWRFLLICLGAFLVWLLIVMLLMRLTGHPHDVGQRPPSTGSSPRGDGSAPPEPHDTGGGVLPYLAGTTLIMFVLLAVASVVAIRRRVQAAPRRAVSDDVPATPAPAGPESLALAAERGLAEIEDLSREPREAIIACYAAMERALADAPGAMPQDSDTPSEVLARAVEHHAIHPGSANELVDLFAEARFSVHVMNEGHRETAVRALQLVLAEVRSAA